MDLIGLLKLILGKASPEIRAALVELVNEWEKKAVATPNKVDDILVWIVKLILDIE